nr:DUF5047 domain-containing protein [Streptomyces sp. WM4235]
MYPVSDRFLETLASDHSPVTEVVLYRADGLVQTLEHTGGSVTVDRKSAARRTCTVSVADPSLIPTSAGDKAALYGATMRISRGVQYSDGVRELVPLGIFRVDSISGDVDEGPATIQGKASRRR